MESFILKRNLSLINCNLKSFYLLFLLVIFCSSSAKAFFENQIQYAFENRWEPMLGDDSVKKRFKAMRSFLIYPELGLPILRNLLMNLRSEKVPSEVAILIGMLGDISDIPHLLNIWKKLENDKRSEVLLGAMQRIYRNNRVSQIANPKLSRLYVNFLEKDFNRKNSKKNAILRYRIENLSKSAIFLRITVHFWKTSSKENFPINYLWLKPGEKIELKKKTKLFPAKHTNNIRVDFRIWEVGIQEKLLHETFNISI